MNHNFLNIIISAIGLLSSIGLFSQNIIKNDSTTAYHLTKPLDSIKTDSTKIIKPKEVLKHIVTHTADGKKVVDLINNKTTLYDNAHVVYGDVDLKAGFIEIDYKNNLIRAKGIISDSLKNYTQPAIFKQGGEETTQDSLIVNYNTERALVWGLKTLQDGDLIVLSNTSKKVNDSTIYVRDIRITTSQKEEPDYDIRINKAKVIPNKKIVAQSAQLYIANVPTIGWVPFAYFPLTKTRTSGILLPTWGENKNQGYFLQNGGYYLAISNYIDLALRGDIYTNGSWVLRANSNYALRYRFNGNFGFSYDNNVNSLRGFDDYGKSVTYNIRWSHNQAPNATPGTRLSASVNVGSSKHYKYSLSEYSSNSFLNNTMNSSINFSKDLYGTPFYLSLGLNHSQNTNTEKITLSLPKLSLSMDTQYPFASKSGAQKNAIHKLGIEYSMNGNYLINTNDDYFFKKQMFKGSKKGIKHNISLSTNMKVLKYFTLNPRADYNEIWAFNGIKKQYNKQLQEIQTDTTTEFKAARDYNFGASLSTNIYGTFLLKKGRLSAIRHTIRPSLSYSYKPDFRFQDRKFYNPESNEYESYTPYLGVYSASSSNVSNRLNLSINNTFEAKVRPKAQDTLANSGEPIEDKKITLLNNLNISTSYDMTKDSLKLSPFNLSASTNLFNNQLSVNLRGTLDPYAINTNGRKIDKANITNGGSLFRLTNGNITFSYNINNDTFKRKLNNNIQTDTQPTDVVEQMMNIESRENRMSTITDNRTTESVNLYKNTLPFNVNLSYSLQYTNYRRERKISNQVLNLNGSVTLTPKWGIGFSSGYNFQTKKITYSSLNFDRDLDSWHMSFSWIPFGYRQSYTFFIGVKSSVLSELKYDKHSLPDKKLF